MPILMYQLPASPACRAVLMTADHLGIEVTTQHVDLFTGEHMKPEFLALNPQHTVPVIDDNGFILWESRAIMSYLVNQYASDSPIYPKDPKARANVDKVLDFDIGNLFKAMFDFYGLSWIINMDLLQAQKAYPQMFMGLSIDTEVEVVLKKSLAIYEKFLEKTPYAAGDHLTIADYSLLASIVFLEEVLDYSYDEFPKISCWMQKMKKEVPKYSEINEMPLRQFKKYLIEKEYMKLKK